MFQAGCSGITCTQYITRLLPPRGYLKECWCSSSIFTAPEGLMLLGFSQCDNHAAFEVKLHCCNVSFDGGKFLIWPKEKVAKVCESVGMLAERHSIKAPSYLSCPDAKFSLAHPPWPDNGAAWSLNVHAHAHACTNPRSPRVLTLLI